MDPATLPKVGAPSIQPVACGLLFNFTSSPTNTIAMTITIIVPIPSMAKKNCNKMKFGAREQPNAPIGAQRVPINSSFLWLNLTIRTPNKIPKTDEATIEIVTNWLVIATKAGSEEPKKVTVTSVKKTNDIMSTINNEK